MKKGLIGAAVEPEQGETQAHEDAESPQKERAEDAAPEEAEQPNENDPHEKIVTAAMTLLYDKGGKGAEQLMQTITGGDSIVDGLVQATQTVVQTLQQKAPNGIPKEALIPAAIEIMGLLADDVEKIKKQEIPGRDVAVASQKLLVGLMQQMGVDPAQIEQALSQVDNEALGQAIDQARAQDAQSGAEAPQSVAEEVAQ